jgi:hypothetical protein
MEISSRWRNDLARCVDDASERRRRRTQQVGDIEENRMRGSLQISGHSSVERHRVRKNGQNRAPTILHAPGRLQRYFFQLRISSEPYK